MEPVTTAAIIGAGANILGRFMGGRQQKRNIQKTNQANLALANKSYQHNLNLAEYGYDRDMEMWKTQNQYNSPQAQMQRFEDAGLNKHMIYGQGTPGNATGMPSFQQPQYQAPTLDYRGTPDPSADALSSFIGNTGDVMDISQKQKNIELTATKTAIAEWNTQSAESKAIVDELNAMVTAGKIGNARIPTSKWAQQTKEAVEQYANQLRNADLSEMEATKLVSKMESELSKVNLTPQNAPIYKILIEVFNQMGFNVDQLLKQ